MAVSSSSVIPTPLAHFDNQGEGHPRGALLQLNNGIHLLESFTEKTKNENSILGNNIAKKSRHVTVAHKYVVLRTLLSF
ncbi:hypothetical protein TNCV_1849991 [Trichonephila clavipes]|nr:hypothetical protein TNCV_1849991 [Trichonephila clavipes]